MLQLTALFFLLLQFYLQLIPSNFTLFPCTSHTAYFLVTFLAILREIEEENRGENAQTPK